MNNNTTITVIAIVAALALFGVVAITIVTIPVQDAEAKGCRTSIAANASKGICINP